jgi:antirestriction protein ArdC
MKQKKKDIYAEITDAVVECLEKGLKPWDSGLRKYDSTRPHNPFTRHNYRGVNFVALQAYSCLKGYTSCKWATLGQIQKAGGALNIGQAPVNIAYFSLTKVKDSATEVRLIPMARRYEVYNLCQTKGLGHVLEKPEKVPGVGDRLARVDRFLKKTGPHVVYNDDENPHYDPELDIISIPNLKKYIKAEGFYADLLHEHIHWTGSEKRLGRFKKKSLSPAAYAFEELVAELGSVFLASDLSVPSRISNHASYVKSWLEQMKEDRRAVFRAASAGAKACDFLKKLVRSVREAPAR